MFVFELTPLPASIKYNQPVREGDTELTFENVIERTKPLSLFCFGIYSENVWITKSGGVLKSYTV